MLFFAGLQPDDPLNNDVFGGLLGGDNFGDENFGEGVLPQLEDLPPLTSFEVTLDPIKESEKKDDEVEKMETDEVTEEKKMANETEESPALTGSSLY